MNFSIDELVLEGGLTDKANWYYMNGLNIIGIN